MSQIGLIGKSKAEKLARALSGRKVRMDPAWIAVIGTLGGVAVTAVSTVTVTSLTTRSQRLTLDRQRDHELAEHRRAERRETFIEYLAAYSELREKVLAMQEQPQPASTPLAEQFPTEVARFSRAYQALRIVSSPQRGRPPTTAAPTSGTSPTPSATTTPTPSPTTATKADACAASYAPPCNTNSDSNPATRRNAPAGVPLIRTAAHLA